MDEKFLECCFNAQHSIFGYRLKPYSLSHLLVLEGRENPLVTREGRVTPPDVIDALSVCSRVQFPFRRNRVSSWGNVCRGILRTNRTAFLDKIDRFYAYQDDFIAVPEFWEDSDELPGAISGPYVLAMATSVMMLFPQLSETRVWTMPLGLLAWYAAQASELKTGKRFWDSEGEDEIEQGLREAEEAITPAMREKAKAIALRHAGKTGGGGVRG